MDREKTCSFTGHRPEKLPWRDNEEDPRCLELKARGVYEERQEPFRILGGSRIFLGRLAGALSRPRASRE